MSYILDALKKAERERGIAQVPTLSTVHDLRAKRPVRLWAASGIVVLCIAGFFWLIFGLDADDGVTPQVAEEVGGVAEHPGQKQVRSPGPVDEPSFGAGPSESHAAPGPGYSRETPARADQTGMEMPRGSMQEPIMNENQDRQPSREPTVPRPSVYASGVSLREPAESVPEQSQMSAAPVEETKPSRDPTGESPVSLGEAMDSMDMSILLYSENRAERLVFVNGRKYVEGDTIDGKYLLESITPEGAVLSYKGERAILRPERN